MGSCATLVGIAFLIALPPTHLLVQRWLEDFAYRVDSEPWTFAAAGILALVSALLTVSFLSLRAATANPVESLRYEWADGRVIAYSAYQHAQNIQQATLDWRARDGHRRHDGPTSVQGCRSPLTKA